MNKAQGALEYLLLVGGAVLVAVIVIVLISGLPTLTQMDCSLEDIDDPRCWTTEVEYVCDRWLLTGELLNCEEVTNIDCTGDYGCSAHTEVICENEELCIHKTRFETKTFKGAIE